MILARRFPSIASSHDCDSLGATFRNQRSSVPFR
jgi:hypothetical protein